MEAPYEYQLAVADYWDPNVWVPGLPLEMTVVAAPPSHHSDLVSVSSPLKLQVEESVIDHQCAVQAFKQAAQSLQDERDKMEAKIHMFPPNMADLAVKYAAPKVVAIGP